MQTLIELFDLKNLIPHGYCLSWSPALLWLNVSSDLLIALAYYSIPLTLIYFLRQRKDLPYPGLVAMFAGFILACGTTHLLSAVTVWIPLYWLDGLVKGVTAALSITAAALMLWLIPRALSLPSAEQLQTEIRQRKTAEDALQAAHVELQQNAAHMQLLLDSALDGIISMDHNGKIIGWNAQAERIFAYSAEQALGRELAELIIPPAYREQHRQGLSRFISTGAASIFGTRLEVTGLRAGFFEFPLELIVSALGQQDDTIFCAYVRDITERKLAETARQEAFDKLQKIAGQLPGVVFQFRLRADGSSCLPYASEGLRDLYRIAPEDVQDDAAKVFTVVHPDDLAGHLASIQTSAHDLSPWRNEYRLKFADGVERWLFGNALPQRELDGSVLWHGFVTDITERKIIEEALRESENKLTTILDSVDAYIYIKDNSYQYQYANKATQQLFGKTMAEIVGESDQAFFDEETVTKLRANDRRVIEQGEHLAAENCYTRKGSAVSLTYFTAKQPLRREDGSIYGLCGISTDITKRKQMEEKLRDSEAFNLSVLNSLTSHIAVLDAQGVIVAVNDAWRQFAEENNLPKSSRSMLGANYLDACKNTFNQPYGDDADSIRSGILAVLAGEQETFHLEYPCHSPTQQRWFYMNVSPLQGSRRGVVVNHKNITERKKTELAKQRSEQQLQAFYDLNLVGLTITSPEKGWLRSNQCLCEMLEYPEHVLHQMTWAQLTYPEDLAADVEQFDKLLANEINGYALEKRFVSRSGKIIPTKLVVRSVRKAAGELDYVVAMVEDITEFKQAEAELKRSNAELEQFAYAVSHDMRQPLRMVSSYLTLLENALAGQLNEENRLLFGFAIDGAKRMDAMILSLLDYSRVGRKTEAKTQISSKASLDEALAFLNPELYACGGDINVTGVWPELFASRDELTRLLQNLIGNALKYHEQDQAPQVHVHGTVSAASWRVEIRDRGIGIEPSQLKRLFKVFSRLQARSRFEGSGVGLALCRKIVEHHGGAIGVESAGEGQGCMFWFELPIVNPVNPE